MNRDFLPRREWAVRRKRLDSLLENGLEYPLITVLAGPGYSKTTTVAHYCMETRHSLIWLHLLPVDNDPQRFWLRFIEAAGQELPELSRIIAEIPFPDSLGIFDVFLRAITETLFAGVEIIIVLDNVENVKNRSVIEFWESLIKVELENLSIIYISNTSPDIARNISGGKLFRIGPSELSFNEQEAQSLFESYGKKLSPAEARDICRDTDGWPLALHLIAAQPGALAPSSFGGAPYMQVIMELFQQNYYANYSEDFQKLLVKLSFLDNIPLGLAQTIGGTSNAEKMMLFTMNIFISYDFSREIFLYQRMYQDFLAKKQTLLSDAERHELFSAAGDWYNQQGFNMDALRCYWTIEDYDRFLETVWKLPRENPDLDDSSWILDKLNRFPKEYPDDNTVQFCRGFMLMNAAKMGQARDVFEKLARNCESAEMDEEKRLFMGDIYTALCDISFAQNTLEAAGFLRKAIALIPGQTRIRSSQTVVVGNNEIFFLPSAEAGSLDSTLRYILDFIPYGRRIYGSSGSGYAYLFAAEGLYFAGRFGDAAEYAILAIHAASDTRQYDIAANGLYLQMRMALFLGDGAKAKSLLQELTDHINAHMPMKLMGLNDCARALYYMQMGDVTKVPVWLSGSKRLSTDIPLDIGRDRIISALYRFMIGEYEEAYTLLLELDRIFAERNLWSVRVVALILKAACQLQMHNEKKAVAFFAEAYGMTWENGLITCFAEYGQITVTLLELARKHAGDSFDPEWMNAVQEASAQYAQRKNTMSKIYNKSDNTVFPRSIELTGREKEILTYLSQGLTRKEISRIYDISINGVKKHITNIYTKLGAINRADALHIAIINRIIE